MIASGPAPHFTLPDQDGNEVSLAGLAGRRTLLVFYPLDFSPVCTDQLSLYEEALPELSARGVDVYGVSVDSAFSHKAFRERLGVTIPLLADFHPKGAVARSYGVFLDERGHNGRALVLIGPDLEVEWSHRSPTPLEIPGAELVLAALDRG